MSSLLRLRATSRKRRKRKNKPKPQFPDGPVMSYRRLLTQVIERTLEVLEQELRRDPTVRQDAIQDDVLAMFDRAKARIGAVVGAATFRERLKDIFVQVDGKVAAEVQKDVARTLGIDVITSVQGRGDKISGYVAENVALITKLQVDMADAVQADVLRAVADGQSTADLANILSDRMRISKKRAKLIARDQVGKVNGALMRERHKSIGVTRYVWRTSLDERVRKEHSAREGQIFSWDAPPSDGHPGQAIMCRCTASAVFDED